MKRDSQADELADQWTLLPGERELSANKSGTTRRLRSASQVLPVRGALSTSRVMKYPEHLLSDWDLTLPLVTRMFLQGLLAEIAPIEQFILDLFHRATATGGVLGPRHISQGIKSGRVDLRYGSVEKLPFEDNLLDQALAINSM